MNKKFLSAILFGALMVTSTGTFVSCKDYDDDIDSINKELTDIKSQLAALQSKVDAGKWITGVSSTANGLAITMSDGQTLNITNGKDGADGAQGEAGAPGKDGKDGSVITVVDGVLCIDGVATEIKVAEKAPAAKPCVKVENGVLMVLGEDGEYVASDLKVSNVTATNTNGVWTITVGEDEIVVPGSAALTSIAIQTQENGKFVTDFYYYYGVVKTAKEWGWNKEEKMDAGFYSKLDRDLTILLNPAEADGTAFEYTFKNSLNVAADVDFFEEARPSTAILTRAASSNGLWTLPAAVTKKDAAEIETLRRELYLNFKQNDGDAYAMSLEAADGLGNVAVRSEYDYKITLAKAPGSVYVGSYYECLTQKVYYPIVTGAVYDYKIRVKQNAEDLRWAKVFGIEITEDGKGFIANNETGVYNNVNFELTYITLDGTTPNVTPEFAVLFTNEMAESNAMQAEALEAPLNATWNRDDGYFEYYYEFDLSEQVDALSDDAKLLWDQAIAEQNSFVNKNLIGGQVSSDGNDYNSDGINEVLKENIKFEIIKRSAKENANLLKVWFLVGQNFTENFQLNTAYQLNLNVIDPMNQAVEVANIALPFEFTQPEIDVVGVDRNYEGSFSKWSSDNVDNKHCDVLYLFGAYDKEKMYLPMYDAFNIWTKAPYVTKNLNPNAQYYKLSTEEITGFAFENDIHHNGEYDWINLNEVSYEGAWNEYPTWINVNNSIITAAVENQGKDKMTVHDTEAWVYVDAEYNFYGVYPATANQLGYYYGDKENTGFRMVFASTIQKSTIEMTEEVLTANAGTNDVFVSNDNVEATTMLGGDFVLFDGLVGDKATSRANLNKERGFNEAQRPFEAPTDYKITAKYANGDDEDIITVDYTNANGAWTVENGKNVAKAEVPEDASIKVILMPSKDAVPATATTTGVEAATGGLFIVLGEGIEDNQPVELTIQVEDALGFYNEFKVVAKKLNK